MKYAALHSARFNLYAEFQVTQTFHTTQQEAFTIKYLSYKSQPFPADLFLFSRILIWQKNGNEEELNALF